MSGSSSSCRARCASSTSSTRTATGFSSRRSFDGCQPSHLMLRPVDVHDVRFLRDMLRHAYHWRLSEDTERPVYRYVANWGRRGDAGVLALDGPHAYGAAWYLSLIHISEPTRQAEISYAV